MRTPASLPPALADAHDANYAEFSTGYARRAGSELRRDASDGPRDRRSAGVAVQRSLPVQSRRRRRRPRRGRDPCARPSSWRAGRVACDAHDPAYHHRGAGGARLAGPPAGPGDGHRLDDRDVRQPPRRHDGRGGHVRHPRRLVQGRGCRVRMPRGVRGHPGELRPRCRATGRDRTTAVPPPHRRRAGRVLRPPTRTTRRRASRGIFCVGTLPHARGQGLGTSVTQAAMRAARQDGVRVAVLQASEMGRPVYERLGFDTVAYITEHLPPPD